MCDSAGRPPYGYHNPNKLTSLFSLNKAIGVQTLSHRARMVVPFQLFRDWVKCTSGPAGCLSELQLPPLTPEHLWASPLNLSSSGPTLSFPTSIEAFPYRVGAERGHPSQLGHPSQPGLRFVITNGPHWQKNHCLDTCKVQLCWARVFFLCYAQSLLR